MPLTQVVRENMNRLKSAKFLEFYQGSDSLDYYGTKNGFVKEWDKKAIEKLIGMNTYVPTPIIDDNATSSSLTWSSAKISLTISTATSGAVTAAIASLSSSIPAIDYNNISGIFSMNSLYDIPLLTDFTSWNNKIDGSGEVGRVSFFNGVNSITSDSSLTWDNTNKWLGIGGTPIAPLSILYAPSVSATKPLLAMGLGSFSGGVGFFNGSTLGTFIGINQASGSTSDFLNFQQAGISRYLISNAGYVGINCSPAYNIDINQINGGTAGAIRVRNYASGGVTTAILDSGGGNQGRLYLYYVNTGYIKLSSGSTSCIGTPTSGLNINNPGVVPVGLFWVNSSAYTYNNNVGLANFGGGGWDGSTVAFKGNIKGTVLAVNDYPAFAGDFANFQLGGVDRFKINNNGSLVFSGNLHYALGKRPIHATGVDGSIGTAVLVSGTITVNNASVTSKTIVWLNNINTGINSGIITSTVNPGAKTITFTSSNVADTSTFRYKLEEVT